MIIFGTGSKQLGNRFIPNEKCPFCGEYNKLHLHASSEYFHIFWIPLFPYRKKLLVSCQSCNKNINKTQSNPSLKDKISLEKSSLKIPIYLFSGLIIIAALILWFQYNSYKHDKFVENKVQNIEKNDILVFKLASNDYSFAIIDSVINNDVFFRNSNYSYSQKPTKKNYEEALLEKSDFFDNESYYYTQTELDSLLKIELLDIFE